MSDIAHLSAVELISHYRRKTLSPVEVVWDVLARREKADAIVNAFCGGDTAQTLAAAKASAARWTAGRPCGPLDGVPVTIKDNIAVAGWSNRKGSAVTPADPATEDAPAVARLREAGAILIGKTTMPEFGWKGLSDSPLTGFTRNPWSTAMTTGGSTSGGAAAAALNIGCIHIGTDGAGSVRIPAAFTGVFGHKPTYGRVPAHPVSAMGFLAHLGPLTRTVEDAALALQVIGQPDPRDMTAMTSAPPDYRVGLSDGVRGMRIAWSPRLGYVETVDPEVEDLARRAAVVFGELGAHVEEEDPGFTDPLDILTTLWSAGAALIVGGFTPDEQARMDPGLIAVAAHGATISGSRYAETLLWTRNELARKMATFHESHDLLLTPTLATPAFTVGHNTPPDGRFGQDWERWTPFTYPFNITQQPAATVPCGLTKDGLPVGLQIVGPFGADALVLRAARAFEAAQPFARVNAPRVTHG